MLAHQSCLCFVEKGGREDCSLELVLEEFLDWQKSPRQRPSGCQRPPTLEDLIAGDHGGWRPDNLSNFNLIVCEGAPGGTCWLVMIQFCVFSIYPTVDRTNNGTEY
jgi:hypothetical protein